MSEINTSNHSLRNNFEILPLAIPGQAGQLICIQYLPDQVNRRHTAIIHIPAFGEEMNKARRMVAMQSRVFAQAGYPVWIPDLYGTGDSEGDLQDASLTIWQQDCAQIIELALKQGAQRVILWGLRFGALLALHLLSKTNIPLDRLIFWQPVISGEMMMTQFLRLRMAADLISDTEKLTTKDMRERLNAGESMEVAGYVLTPGLVDSIDHLKIKSLMPKRELDCSIHWFELNASEQRPLPVPSKKLVDEWRAQGQSIELVKVVAEPFWNTIEISEAPLLLEQTLTCIQSSSSEAD